jgi:ribosomal protein L40E
MPQETVGYVKLEWTCKRCGSRNPGTTKICATCGSVMGDADKFELPAQQELIKDEQEVALAQAGPDMTCQYCGARNRADAKNCSQCGADLAEATVRQAGEALGAFDSAPKPDVKCPYCGEPNPAGALKCKNCAGSLTQRPADKSATQPAARPIPARQPNVGLIGAIGVLAVALCAIVFILSSRTTDITAAVQSVQWQRSIAILGPVPVTRETWQDQIPADAHLGNCVERVRRTQDEPAPNADKICGTPYTIDTGSGFGKVVQDCQYQVKDQWCEYTMTELGVVDTVVVRGSYATPRWPTANLHLGQREGDRTEQYVIGFSSDDKQYEYTTNDPDEFARFTLGSRWILKVNALGGVRDVQPAK